MAEHKAPAPLSLEGPQDVRRLLEEIGLRLHAANRIAMGEQRFVWWVAETMRQLGQVFEEQIDDPETRRDFGDGYTRGRLSEAEQRERMAALLVRRR